MARKGSQFGDKKLVVITGTSSGLGKATTTALLNAKEYHVIGAVPRRERHLDQTGLTARRALGLGA